MSNTTHEDKFIPSKQPNALKRALQSRVLPWFIVTILVTASLGVITGWMLARENDRQINAAVAAASLAIER
ncbi:hypothetical protein [Rathayibacter sp. AY1C5]|uniref:hypothetical protein n=1 Tax=Rathayibacter sp. AY1C5 TaxID=2080538 RepID=UPI000CE79367|nr:hypothetical protein [Rathayibacter sp. AY1C5]PPG60280.1 hypothetical protein C5C57_05625 [Rathayibacter sp. AY1C5]